MRKETEGGASSHHGESLDTEPSLQGSLKEKRLPLLFFAASGGCLWDGESRWVFFCPSRDQPPYVGVISQVKAVP